MEVQGPGSAALCRPQNYFWLALAPTPALSQEIHIHQHSWEEGPLPSGGAGCISFQNQPTQEARVLRAWPRACTAAGAVCTTPQRQSIYLGPSSVVLCVTLPQLRGGHVPPPPSLVVEVC